MKPNQLINELSPYLQQHAYNPVNWFPWSEKAFQKAKEENKPIFLSIGYSTCHWCHVMEKESFEDDYVAEILNENFVSIKVDREERPDIDSIYMTACQLINGRGGWPLSIFLTPDKKPFFAGTYFPKQSFYGRIGFIELLQKISQAWKFNNSEILNSANELTKMINKNFNNKSSSIIDNNIIENSYSYFCDSYDKEYGGFNNAPKFPSPHNLMFLLRYNYLNVDTQSIEMVSNTLTKMRLGGIYDHIGFGFHRYSTDKKWLVPHFEKMLYDQALLMIIYSEAYQLTKKELFKKTVFEIYDYLTKKLLSNTGAYFSAEDADSESEEGKFYLWTNDELKSIFDKPEFDLIEKFFNISPKGNYIDEFTRSCNGKNILYMKNTLNEFALSNNFDINKLTEEIEKIRLIIYVEREKRIHPFKDEKILSDWNSLVITAFSIAGRVFNNSDLITSAKKIIDFIFNKMFISNNELLHRYKDGKSEINATLDDYAYFIWGLIEYYQTTLDDNFVNKIKNLIEVTVEKFYDSENGGFYLADKNSTDLIVRTKDLYDGAIPSGNSIMLYNLIKFNSISFDNTYNEIIIKTFSFFAEQINNSPFAFNFSNIAFMNYIQSTQLIIIYKEEIELIEAVNKLNEYFLPFLTIISFNYKSIPENFTSYNLKENKTTFFLCKNFNCYLPTNIIEEVIDWLINKK